MDVREKQSSERRLIDANSLLRHKRKMSGADFGGEFWDEAVLISDIKNAPTVDAVEVLRCWECKYWGDEDGKLQGSDGVLFAGCKVHNYLIDGRHTGWCPTENDFCSYGERKEGAD